MTGFLSSMFDGGSDQYGGQQHLGVSEQPDVHQAVDVHTETAMSYQDADGTTQTYSSSHDVGVDVGLQATLAAAVDTTEGLGTHDTGF